MKDKRKGRTMKKLIMLFAMVGMLAGCRGEYKMKVYDTTVQNVMKATRDYAFHYNYQVIHEKENEYMRILIMTINNTYLIPVDSIGYGVTSNESSYITLYFDQVDHDVAVRAVVDFTYHSTVTKRYLKHLQAQGLEVNYYKDHRLEDVPDIYNYNGK
jgi:hypothetical protein